MDDILTTLNARLGQVRRETLNGRGYLVAPFVSLVSGRVLNGSKGKLLYPAHEVVKNPGVWNHIPITLGHPSDPVTNLPQSARHPKVLNRVKLGEVYEDHVANGERRGEAWFDEQLTRDRAPSIWNRLNDAEKGKNAESLELSTGLFTQDVPAANGSRTRDGQDYDWVATSYQPDHLAVFEPGTARGACSTGDGCGVKLNQGQTDNTYQDTTLMRLNRSFWARAFEYLGFTGANNQGKDLETGQFLPGKTNVSSKQLNAAVQRGWGHVGTSIPPKDDPDDDGDGGDASHGLGDRDNHFTEPPDRWRAEAEESGSPGVQPRTAHSQTAPVPKLGDAPHGGVPVARNEEGEQSGRSNVTRGADVKAKGALDRAAELDDEPADNGDFSVKFKPYEGFKKFIRGEGATAKQTITEKSHPPKPAPTPKATTAPAPTTTPAPAPAAPTTTPIANDLEVTGTGAAGSPISVGLANPAMNSHEEHDMSCPACGEKMKSAACNCGYKMNASAMSAAPAAFPPPAASPFPPRAVEEDEEAEGKKKPLLPWLKKKGGDEEEEATTEGKPAPFGGKKAPAFNKGADMALTNKQRQEAVGYLTANCDCWKGKGAVLANKEAFSDEDLVRFVENAEKQRKSELVVNAVTRPLDIGFGRTIAFDPTVGRWVTNEKSEGSNGDDTGSGTVQAGGEEGNKEEETDSSLEGGTKVGGSMGTPSKKGVTNARKVTTNEWLARPDVPDEVKAVVRNGIELRDAEKARLTGLLTQNVRDPELKKRLTANHLKKSLEQLRDEAAALPNWMQTTVNQVQHGVQPPAPAAPVYGGGLRIAPDLTDNASADDGDVLDIPTMNWDDERTPVRQRA